MFFDVFCSHFRLIYPKLWTIELGLLYCVSLFFDLLNKKIWLRFLNFYWVTSMLDCGMKSQWFFDVVNIGAFSNFRASQWLLWKLEERGTQSVEKTGIFFQLIPYFFAFWFLMFFSCNFHNVHKLECVYEVQLYVHKSKCVYKSKIYTF